MDKGSIEDGLVYHAGFPNTAEDGNLGSLSLDSLVVKRRASTFFWRLSADISELHWPAGSILVVDRSLSPNQGSVAVVVADSEFVLAQLHQKTLRRLDGSGFESELIVWGVVTYCLQPVGKGEG